MEGHRFKRILEKITTYFVKIQNNIIFTQIINYHTKTINMKSMSTGGECYKGEYIHSIPEQVVAGGNGQVLYLRKMGSLKNYKINYYSIITGDLVYTTSVHQSDINGRLFVEHPILFQSSTEFMYAFKAYRVNDGAFLAAQKPLIEQKEPERAIDVEINNLSLIDVKSGFNTKYVDIISNTIFTNLALYSIDGKFIGNYSLENNGVEIDFSSITKGVYIVVAQNKLGETLTTKIVW